MSQHVLGNKVRNASILFICLAVAIFIYFLIFGTDSKLLIEENSRSLEQNLVSQKAVEETGVEKNMQPDSLKIKSHNGASISSESDNVSAIQLILEKYKKKPDISKLSEAELFAIDNWQKELGMDADLMFQYSGYDIETLLSLAEANDIYALDKLAQRGNVNDNLYKIIYKSAALGSLNALCFIQNAKIDTFKAISSGYSVEEKQDLYRNLIGEEMPENYMDELDYIAASNAIIAMIRGDVWDGIGFFEEIDNNRPGGNFSVKELEKIYLRALEKFDHIESLRTKMGLGSFENSWPPEYAKLYGFENSNKIYQLLVGYKS